MNKKVIVVHPGKQHSFRLAEALKKNNMLLNYITTVYDKKHSLTHLFGGFLKGDNKKRFLTRKSDVFDENVVQFCEFEGLILLLLYRILPKSKITINVEKYIHKLVYLKAIKFAAKNNADAIVFYGGLSEKHFELKNKICPNIKFIVDVPIATNEYMQKVLENDIKITGDEYIRIEQAAIWQSSEGKTPIRYKLADGFLAGSEFVKKSLTDFGTDANKIKIVPYGVDTSRFTLKDFGSKNQKVRFIFVGRVNRRKGIQHLLPAFEKLDSDKAELILVGQYDENDVLVKKYKNAENITFKGFVTQDVVTELYKSADVFVLPSLGEGLAQVCIEAMASGLPVVVSENTGITDLITDGNEGLIVPASDTAKLFGAMNWFVENKKSIPDMGLKAYNTAKKYTWDYYESNAAAAISELLGE